MSVTTEIERIATEFARGAAYGRWAVANLVANSILFNNAEVFSVIEALESRHFPVFESEAPTFAPGKTDVEVYCLRVYISHGSRRHLYEYIHHYRNADRARLALKRAGVIVATAAAAAGVVGLGMAAMKYFKK